MKSKKFLSVFLSALLLAFSLSAAFTSYAYPINESLETLKGRFADGNGELDYCYYSPVKNKNDNTKYPLIIWLHGNNSGNYPRQQLDKADVGYWASDGAQSFFDGGGAFIFLPRHNPAVGLAWEGKTEVIKRMADGFIKIYKNNINMSKIYVGGYSMGGAAAFKQILNYRDFYAAAYLMSPFYTPTPQELDNVGDIPIWLFTCKLDFHAPLNPLSVKTNWTNLCNASRVRNKIRWTEFDACYNRDGSVRSGDPHNAWDCVTYDLFTDKNVPFNGMRTVDGNGNAVKLSYPNGFLYWLNSQQLQKRMPKRNLFADFFRKIWEFFKKIFSVFFR